MSRRWLATDRIRWQGRQAWAKGRGPAGPSVLRGEIDRASYTMKLIMSDGSEVPLHCRGFFEQYHSETSAH